jgi:hypothetical protein
MNLKIIGTLQKELDLLEKQKADGDIVDVNTVALITEFKNAFIQIQNDIQRIDNVLNALKGKEKQ